MHPRTAAFTLVELSITLVIIGLLVGGILGGKTLIHAAELRNIGAEAEKYKGSVGAFMDKYIAYPGDMVNAQNFWGVLHATPSTCDTTAATTGSTATCNGNGDKLVGFSTGLGYEPLRFWQHLANGGMVDGFYTGTGTSYQVTAGTNVPPSKYPTGVWCTRYRDAGGGGSVYYDETTTNHMFVFGTDSGANPCEGRILTPEDALGIDIKLDDGKPSTGLVQAFWRTLCTTSSATDDRTATYKLTTTTQVCSLFFRKAF